MLLSACMCLLFVAACGKVGDLEERYTDDDQPYELVYYMPYINANPPQDIGAVQDQLNKVLKKKINSTIKIYAYTMAEYTSKMSGIIAARTKFDVCFTSPDMNPYTTNVQKKRFCRSITCCRPMRPKPGRKFLRRFGIRQESTEKSMAP